MDVNLPDGRVLRNVPEGTTKAQIIAKLKANGEDVSWAEPKQASGAETLAKQTGIGESILIGAGRKTDAMIDGLTQRFLQMLGDDKALSGLAQNVAEKEAIYAPLKKEHPFATGVGEAAPALAGGGSALGGMVASAIPELASYGDMWQNVKNAGVAAGGSLLGTAIGKGVGRLLKPAGPGTQAISPEAKAAADRVGYSLSPGEISQNPAQLALENYLRRSPGSSGPMQVRDLANKAAMNKAAASAMGQTADDLGENVFSAAKNAIGAEFQRLQGVTAPNVTNDLLNASVKLDTANAAKGAFRNSEVDKLVEKALDLASQGKLTGTAYKEIRSEISARSAEATDAVVANAYREIRGALDKAAKASLSKADQEAWDITRSQWHAYKLLTKGNVSEAGNVSAARLASAMRAEGDALRTGAANGPLADVARLGEALKSVPNPTSGQLTQMSQMPTATGLAAIAGNKALGGLYNSKAARAYLGTGLIDIGPNGQLLLGATGAPLGIYGLRKSIGNE